MKKIILLSLFLLVSSIAKAADDPVIHTKEFKDALTYLVAYNLYWHIWRFTDSEFNYDPDAGGWKVYPYLGKTIHARINKKENTYIIISDELSGDFTPFFLTHQKDGSWYQPGTFSSDKPLEQVSDDYEFTLPANYIDIASKFGKDTGPIVEKLKKSLKTLINELDDAEAGTHHLYIGPFSNYVFPGIKDLSIYWREGNAFILLNPLGGRDVADWDAADYYIDTFKFNEGLPYRNHPEDEEATYLEEKQWKIDCRVFWESVKIANCVRDGVMVTIEKPKPPDDPAIHTEEFTDALTYLVAYKLYWHIWRFTDSDFNYDSDANGWKVYPYLGKTIHAKIEKQGNKYSVYFKNFPKEMDVSLTYEDDNWHKTRESSSEDSSQSYAGESSRLISSDYEFILPANYIEIASEFGKDTGPAIEKLKKSLQKLIDKDKNAKVGTHHLYIGPFNNYIFPGYYDIVIYWQERKSIILIVPYSLKCDVADWDAASYNITILKKLKTPYCPGNCEDKEKAYLEHKYSEADMRMFCTDIKVANCIMNGMMITIEKTKPTPEKPLKK